MLSFVSLPPSDSLVRVANSGSYWWWLSCESQGANLLGAICVVSMSIVIAGFFDFALILSYDVKFFVNRVI